jgi:hypothetical protein
LTFDHRGTDAAGRCPQLYMTYPLTLEAPVI